MIRQFCFPCNQTTNHRPDHRRGNRLFTRCTICDHRNQLGWRTEFAQLLKPIVTPTIQEATLNNI